MSKFISGMSDDVVKECINAMLVKKMELSRSMFHAQQIKEEKLKERKREKRGAKTGSFSFSQQRSDGKNYSQFRQKSSDPFLSSFSALVPNFKQDN